MTDVQWRDFREGLGGLWIVGWSGWIEEVGDRSILAGGYPVTIRITSDCFIYYVVPDESTALRFSKGQRVTVTGQIDWLWDFLGIMTLYMEDYTVEVR
jgi:hypothetical protein